MKCVLMHKNLEVTSLQLNEMGYISKIDHIMSPKHLPIGVRVIGNKCDKKSLNDWWLKRSIPASRDGILDVINVLKMKFPTELLTCCYGLSLSDQYWIKPKNSQIEWENINFFDNDFSEDMGKLLFTGKKIAVNNGLNLISPDNTSDGWLRKKWKIIDGKRFLIKGGSVPFRQEPFNEKIASEIMRRLKINHVSYDVIWDNDMPYSICENFITPDTELVPAWRIVQAKEKSNDISPYQHFLECCDMLGINTVDTVRKVDQMMTVDYIIKNTDRHYNNFGFIRDPETLEWLGFAPIYDSGTSLDYIRSRNQIILDDNIECKPFGKNFSNQLDLIQSFDSIDFSLLNGIRDWLVNDLLLDQKIKDLLEDERIDKISQGVEYRTSILSNFTYG